MTLSHLKSLFRSTDRMVLQPASPALQFGTLRWNDKAALAMTDFRNSPMISTHGQESIEATLQRMKMSGARFLFVLDEHEQLAGSITSYDIQGERPLRFLNAVGYAPGTGAWRDVQVRDIMDPLRDWVVLEHVHVARLSIGDVARLMGLRDLRYLVVVEASAEGDVHRVRGLFSAARIQQLLGEEAVVQGEAQAAAEAVHALA